MPHSGDPIRGEAQRLQCGFEDSNPHPEVVVDCGRSSPPAENWTAPTSKGTASSLSVVASAPAVLRSPGDATSGAMRALVWGIEGSAVSTISGHDLTGGSFAWLNTSRPFGTNS